ncbi:S23 ribosomal protein [Desulfonatronospira thiodismutans ASO3-1]|uniref:S23 ribosomal protein n=1 Tax=Desulfonatronospira thiodismutans ASO3-1 TaxID=555779 RepID=D6STZ5_9BACT|nr:MULTISPECIES: four helix bundle protein [Desulfonatronospira]EFI34161.1 S23 ribosomal protein [Desulfonatronospira thiodismutans ASO3-1]RQD73189.1 MAG: four helix bundle protein [Desulfonatronospira sp. MSAO_Bac3]
MGYKYFEELPCWQVARELCQEVQQIIHQERFRRDFSLKDQISRSSGSIMDNIAEGFDDGSSREFVRFLGYSQRSCGEVQSQLYRAWDCQYLNRDQFSRVYHLAGECRKQIKGFRRYLRENSF